MNQGKKTVAVIRELEVLLIIPLAIREELMMTVMIAGEAFHPQMINLRPEETMAPR
jgi:hypothetical protein